MCCFPSSYIEFEQTRAPLLQSYNRANRVKCVLLLICCRFNTYMLVHVCVFVPVLVSLDEMVCCTNVGLVRIQQFTHTTPLNSWLRSACACVRVRRTIFVTRLESPISVCFWVRAGNERRIETRGTKKARKINSKKTIFISHIETVFVLFLLVFVTSEM